MATNYSRHDKLRGNEAWGLPICLALAAGLLYGIAKYGTNHNPNLSHYTPRPEVRAVESRESQDLCSRDPNDLEKLVDKYRREKR